MRRRLLKFARVVSLALFLVTVASWVRSYRVADDLRRETRSSQGVIVAEHGIGHARGRWGIFTSRYTVTPPEVVTRWRWRRQPAANYPVARDTILRQVGFGFELHDGPDLRGGTAWVPHWMLALFTSILPARWWIARRRRRLAEHRRAHGLCVRCGYDLRGSPTRCPECAAVPAAPLTA